MPEWAGLSGGRSSCEIIGYTVFVAPLVREESVPECGLLKSWAREKTNIQRVRRYWESEWTRIDLRISADDRLSPQLLRLAEDGVTKKAMPAV